MSLAEKKIPMRRCAGCMEQRPKREMIRVAGYEGEVGIDATGKTKGRGIYLCPDEKCFALAKKKKAVGRGLNMEISKERLDELFRELEEYAAKDK